MRAHPDFKPPQFDDGEVLLTLPLALDARRLLAFTPTPADAAGWEQLTSATQAHPGNALAGVLSVALDYVAEGGDFEASDALRQVLYGIRANLPAPTASEPA